VKYERFEEVPVWKEAAKLAAAMFRLCGNAAFRGKGDLANQLQRAALSISNNIAEGFERGTTQELITFLYYAWGSAAEVRSMLTVMEMMPEFGALQAEIRVSKKRSESIARQIRGWAQSLQDGRIKGQRYLTEEVRERERRQKSREAFERKLEALARRNRGF